MTWGFDLQYFVDIISFLLPIFFCLYWILKPIVTYLLKEYKYYSLHIETWFFLSFV